MKVFCLVLALCSLTLSARAGEYDRRVAEDYAARKAAAGEAAVASYAASAARARERITSYVVQRGGDPAGVSCTTSTAYSCDGSLCTPWARGSLRLAELGAPGHLFRSCDFTIGSEACKVEHSECTYRDYGDKEERCRKASLRVSCMDEQRRAREDFIYAPGAEKAWREYKRELRSRR